MAQVAHRVASLCRKLISRMGLQVDMARELSKTVLLPKEGSVSKMELQWSLVRK